jgi:hypothetical protein
MSTQARKGCDPAPPQVRPRDLAVAWWANERFRGYTLWAESARSDVGDARSHIAAEGHGTTDLIDKTPFDRYLTMICGHGTVIVSLTVKYAQETTWRVISRLWLCESALGTSLRSMRSRGNGEFKPTIRDVMRPHWLTTLA